MSDNLNHLLHCFSVSFLFSRIKTTLYVCFIVRSQFWMVIIGSTDYQSFKSVPLRLCVSFLMASAILNLSLPKKTGFELKNGKGGRKLGRGGSKQFYSELTSTWFTREKKKKKKKKKHYCRLKVFPFSIS